MATKLASAFVEVKPETAGFKAKVEAETKGMDAKVKVHPDIDRNSAKSLFDKFFTSAGVSGGNKMVSGITQSLESSASEIVPYLAIAAAAAAPAIGAAINAGVLLGLGGGGIAAGIALAARDPEVAGAGKAVGQHVLEGLTQAAESFKEPVINSVNILGSAFDRLQPRIQAIFSGLAPHVEQLATGIAGLFDRIGPGLQQAFTAAGPILDTLSAELPRLGSAMSSFFSSIAAGGPGATIFFRDLLVAVEGSLIGIGKLIEGLSKLYEISSKIPGLGGAFQALGNAIGSSGDKGKKAFFDLQAGSGSAKGGIDLVAQSARAAEQAVAALAKSSEQILNEWLSVDQANIRVSQSFLDLKASVEQNGKSLDSTSAKGLANQSALLAVASAAEVAREKNIAGGQSASYANSQYEAQIGTLFQNAAALGLNQQQVEGLIGKYRHVPGDSTTTTHSPGLDEALKKSGDLIGNYYSLNGKTATTTFRTIFVTEGSPTPASRPGLRIAFAHGGILQAAQGMIVDSPTVLFGERGTGHEVYIPEKGISDSRGLALADAAARMHGGRVTTGDGWAGEVRLDQYTIRRLGATIGDVVAQQMGGALSASSAASSRRVDLLVRGG
jgi:hypothetical protein